jgi:hypothetical protein
MLAVLARDVLERAAVHAKGLGVLDHDDLIRGTVPLPALDGLDPATRCQLVGEAVALFVEQALCFRQAMGDRTLLVFPSQIRIGRPEAPATIVEGSVYSLSGPDRELEWTFATLIVLLGYSPQFRRVAVWKDGARFDCLRGPAFGFRRLPPPHEGRVELVLEHGGPDIDPSCEALMEALFEDYVRYRSATVEKFPAVFCSHCRKRQGCGVVVERIRARKGFLYCADCGGYNFLPAAPVPVSPIAGAGRPSDADRVIRFKEAVTRLMPTAARKSCRCFVSYAWGDPEHEAWVEDRLVRDLADEGIDVLFDRHHSPVGRSIIRFAADDLDACDYVVPVGTPLYLVKWLNKDPSRGSVVAIEVDVMSQRFTGEAPRRETVLPVLRQGTRDTALPSVMRSLPYFDFHDDGRYYSALFDLLVALFGCPTDDRLVRDLQRALVP